jgi:hypothetical protein
VLVARNRKPAQDDETLPVRVCQEEAVFLWVIAYGMCVAGSHVVVFVGSAPSPAVVEPERTSCLVVFVIRILRLNAVVVATGSCNRSCPARLFPNHSFAMQRSLSL